MRTMVAAMATARRVNARRSRMTAISMTETMMNARSVATLPPESARYPAPAIKAAAAAIFFTGQNNAAWGDRTSP